LKTLLTEKVHLATLRFYPNEALPPNSDAWEWLMEDGSRSPPGNHAKIYIVDDELFYVGSDNAYPIYWNMSGLQEFGYLVAKTEADGTLWQPLRSYWDSLWQYSRWAQFDWSTLAEGTLSPGSGTTQS